MGSGDAAQTTGDAPAAQDGGGIAEIVVTAQRRDQSLQDVPLAVSAISAEAIVEAGLTDTLSVSKLVPNVQVRTFGGVPNIFIRGVGNNDFNATTISPVAVYRDEVVLISTASQIFPLFDLERVEVLRGPQGTLFGKNTTGGALSYISRRPGDEFEGYLRLGYGRFDLRTAEAAVTVPLGEDFGVRISGSSRENDGDRINIFNNSRERKVDLKAGRIVALAQPTPELTVTGIAYVARDRSDYDTGKPVGVLPGGTDALGYRDPFPDDERIVNINLDSRHYADDLGLTGIVEYDFGGVTLKSITGFDKADADNRTDTDQSPNQLNEAFFISRTKQFTQELNLSGRGDRLDWIAGLYYSWDRIRYRIDENLLGSLSASGGDLPLLIRSGRNTEAYAAYGQATFSVTPELRLTGGLRFTQEEQDSFHGTNLVKGYFDPLVPDAAPFPIIPYREFDQSWGRFSYRASIDYDFTPDVLGYASVNRSFKSGGVYLAGLTDPAEQSVFDPEYIMAYEIGIKSTLFDRRLRLNASIFHYDYSDLQALNVGSAAGGGVPAIILENAADARVWGAEVEFDLRPTRGLSISGGLGWLDAKYGNYPSAGLDSVTGLPLDYSGNRLPGAPEFTGNLAVTYDTNLSGGWSASFRGDINYVGKRFFDSSNVDLIGDDEYAVVNARIALITPGDRFEIALWGRNLTDTVYLTNASDLRSLGYVPFFFGDRRTYGIEGLVRF